ncbi:MAG: ABC transporter permease, partial [Ginsengibacter sp.]
ILMYSKTGYQLAVKINGRQNVAGFRTFLESEWKKYSPDEPVQYTFLDEDFGALANKESILSKAVTFFTILALIIAGIGLFALSTFTIEQRIKEIGIRKVLGADVKNIVTLLSKDFMKLVIIAAFIAFPLAWWLMHTWLQDFAYRVNLSWWIFVASGLMALIIALITVSFQAIKAAVANPVKSLRTE